MGGLDGLEDLLLGQIAAAQPKVVLDPELPCPRANGLERVTFAIELERQAIDLGDEFCGCFDEQLDSVRRCDRAVVDDAEASDCGARLLLGRSSSSRLFITTVVFAGVTPRAVSSLAYGSCTVITRFAKRVAMRSIRRNSLSAKAAPLRPSNRISNMSGERSWMSRMTFAPSRRGNTAARIRKSGGLWI